MQNEAIKTAMFRGQPESNINMNLKVADRLINTTLRYRLRITQNSFYNFILFLANRANSHKFSLTTSLEALSRC